MKCHEWIFLMFTTIICCTATISIAQVQQRGRVKFGLAPQKDETADPNPSAVPSPRPSRVRASTPRASSRFRATEQPAISTSTVESKEVTRSSQRGNSNRSRSEDRSAQKLEAEATELVPSVRTRKRVSPTPKSDQPTKVQLSTSSGDRTNVIRRGKSRSEAVPPSPLPAPQFRRRSDVTSEEPIENIRKVRTYTARSVTRQVDEEVSSELPLMVTTVKNNWKTAASRRGSAKSKSSERVAKSLLDDQLEDENYPEHFKLLLKKQQPNTAVPSRNLPRPPVPEDPTLSKLNEIYDATQPTARFSHPEPTSTENSNEVLQVSRAIPKIRRAELKREDTARAALKSRRVEAQTEEVAPQIRRKSLKSRRNEPATEEVTYQPKDTSRAPPFKSRRVEAPSDDIKSQVKPNEILEAAKPTKPLFIPRRAEPYRPKLATTTARSTTTPKFSRKPDDLRVKFKPRVNARLQFPSLKTKTTAMPEDISRDDNEILNVKPSPQPIRPPQITKSKNLALDRPSFVDTKPKSKTQKFSSRYRGDAYSRYQQKTEPSKPIYTPTIPAVTTEPIPLSMDRSPSRTAKAVTLYDPESHDLQEPDSKYNGVIFDDKAGVWNMVEPIAGGLTRSEIIVDNDEEPPPQSAVTVSIFEALAEILSKTPTTTSSTTTTTTTSTTTSTTELPEIIQVPAVKIDSMQIPSTTVNTHLITDVDDEYTTTNEITNNDRNGRILNSMDINDQPSTTLDTLSTNDPTESLETSPITETHTTQTEQTTQTLLTDLTTLALSAEPTQPTFTNNTLTDLSTNTLELTTIASNPPSSLPMPYLADALTTPGSHLVTQPQLISAISNFLDTSVQNASETMATTTTTTATLDTDTEQVTNSSTTPEASNTLSPPTTSPSTESPPVTISFLDLFTIQPKKVNQNTMPTLELHPIYKEPDASTTPAGRKEKTFNSQTTGRPVNIHAFFGTQTYPSIAITGGTSTDRINELSSTFQGVSEASVTGGVTTDTLIPEQDTSTSSTSYFEYTPPQSTSRTQSLPIHLNSILGSTQKYEQTSPSKTVQTASTTTIRSRFGNNRLPILPAGSIPIVAPIRNTTTSTTSTTSSTTTTTSAKTTTAPTTSVTQLSPEQEQQQQQLSNSIPTTEQQQQLPKHIKDFSVYGILPNNTVIRKRPPQVSRTLDVGLIVYGILPNRTVVRKYPNGSLAIVDSSQDVEVVNIDPKMLFNPFSELYRTSQSSLLLTTHRSTTSHRLIESNHIVSSGSSSSTEVPTTTATGAGRRGNSLKDTTDGGGIDATTTNGEDVNLIQLLNENEDNLLNSTSLVEANTENAVLLDLLKRKYINSDIPSRSSNVVSLTTARNVIEESSIQANAEEDVSENTLFDSSEEKRKDISKSTSSEEDLLGKLFPANGSVVPNAANTDDDNVISHQFDTFANGGRGSIFEGNKGRALDFTQRTKLYPIKSVMANQTTSTKLFLINTNQTTTSATNNTHAVLSVEDFLAAVNGTRGVVENPVNGSIEMTPMRDGVSKIIDFGVLDSEIDSETKSQIFMYPKDHYGNLGGEVVDANRTLSISPGFNPSKPIHTDELPQTSTEFYEFPDFAAIPPGSNPVNPIYEGDFIQTSTESEKSEDFSEIPPGSSSVKPIYSEDSLQTSTEYEMSSEMSVPSTGSIPMKPIYRDDLSKTSTESGEAQNISPNPPGSSNVKPIIKDQSKLSQSSMESQESLDTSSISPVSGQSNLNPSSTESEESPNVVTAPSGSIPMKPIYGDDLSKTSTESEESPNVSATPSGSSNVKPIIKDQSKLSQSSMESQGSLDTSSIPTGSTQSNLSPSSTESEESPNVVTAPSGSIPMKPIYGDDLSKTSTESEESPNVSATPSGSSNVKPIIRDQSKLSQSLMESQGSLDTSSIPTGSGQSNLSPSSTESEESPNVFTAPSRSIPMKPIYRDDLSKTSTESGEAQNISPNPPGSSNVKPIIKDQSKLSQSSMESQESLDTSSISPVSGQSNLNPSSTESEESPNVVTAPSGSIPMKPIYGDDLSKTSTESEESPNVSATPSGSSNVKPIIKDQSKLSQSSMESQGSLDTSSIPTGSTQSNLSPSSTESEESPNVVTAPSGSIPMKPIYGDDLSKTSTESEESPNVSATPSGSSNVKPIIRDQSKLSQSLMESQESLDTSSIPTGSGQSDLSPSSIESEESPNVFTAPSRSIPMKPIYGDELSKTSTEFEGSPNVSPNPPGSKPIIRDQSMSLDNSSIPLGSKTIYSQGSDELGDSDSSLVVRAKLDSSTSTSSTNDFNNPETESHKVPVTFKEDSLEYSEPEAATSPTVRPTSTSPTIGPLIDVSSNTIASIESASNTSDFNQSSSPSTTTIIFDSSNRTTSIEVTSSTSGSRSAQSSSSITAPFKDDSSNIVTPIEVTSSTSGSRSTQSSSTITSPIKSSMLQEGYLVPVQVVYPENYLEKLSKFLETPVHKNLSQTNWRVVPKDSYESVNPISKLSENGSSVTRLNTSENSSKLSAEHAQNPPQLNAGTANPNFSQMDDSDLPTPTTSSEIDNEIFKTSYAEDSFNRSNSSSKILDELDSDIDSKMSNKRDSHEITEEVSNSHSDSTNQTVASTSKHLFTNSDNLIDSPSANSSQEVFTYDTGSNSPEKFDLVIGDDFKTSDSKNESKGQVTEAVPISTFISNSDSKSGSKISDELYSVISNIFKDSRSTETELRSSETDSKNSDTFGNSEISNSDSINEVRVKFGTDSDRNESDFIKETDADKVNTEHNSVFPLGFENKDGFSGLNKTGLISSEEDESSDGLDANSYADATPILVDPPERTASISFDDGMPDMHVVPRKGAVLISIQDENDFPTQQDSTSSEIGQKVDSLTVEKGSFNQNQNITQESQVDPNIVGGLKVTEVTTVGSRDESLNYTEIAHTSFAESPGSENLKEKFQIVAKVEDSEHISIPGDSVKSFNFSQASQSRNTSFEQSDSNQSQIDLTDSLKTTTEESLQMSVVYPTKDVANEGPTQNLKTTIMDLESNVNKTAETNLTEVTKSNNNFEQSLNISTETPNNRNDKSLDTKSEDLAPKKVANSFGDANLHEKFTNVVNIEAAEQLSRNQSQTDQSNQLKSSAESMLVYPSKPRISSTPPPVSLNYAEYIRPPVVYYPMNMPKRIAPTPAGKAAIVTPTNIQTVIGSTTETVHIAMVFPNNIKPKPNVALPGQFQRIYTEDQQQEPTSTQNSIEGVPVLSTVQEALPTRVTPPIGDDMYVTSPPLYVLDSFNENSSPKPMSAEENSSSKQFSSNTESPTVMPNHNLETTTVGPIIKSIFIPGGMPLEFVLGGMPLNILSEPEKFRKPIEALAIENPESSPEDLFIAAAKMFVPGGVPKDLLATTEAYPMISPYSESVSKIESSSEEMFKPDETTDSNYSPTSTTTTSTPQETTEDIFKTYQMSLTVLESALGRVENEVKDLKESFIKSVDRTTMIPLSTNESPRDATEPTTPKTEPNETSLEIERSKPPKKDLVQENLNNEVQNLAVDVQTPEPLGALNLLSSSGVNEETSQSSDSLREVGLKSESLREQFYGEISSEIHFKQNSTLPIYGELAESDPQIQNNSVSQDPISQSVDSLNKVGFQVMKNESESTSFPQDPLIPLRQTSNSSLQSMSLKKEETSTPFELLEESTTPTLEIVHSLDSIQSTQQLDDKPNISNFVYKMAADAISNMQTINTTISAESSNISMSDLNPSSPSSSNELVANDDLSESNLDQDQYSTAPLAPSQNTQLSSSNIEVESWTQTTLQEVIDPSIEAQIQNHTETQYTIQQHNHFHESSTISSLDNTIHIDNLKNSINTITEPNRVDNKPAPTIFVVPPSTTMLPTTTSSMIPPTTTITSSTTSTSTTTPSTTSSSTTPSTTTTTTATTATWTEPPTTMSSTTTSTEPPTTMTSITPTTSSTTSSPKITAETNVDLTNTNSELERNIKLLEQLLALQSSLNSKSSSTSSSSTTTTTTTTTTTPQPPPPSTTRPKTSDVDDANFLNTLRQLLNQPQATKKPTTPPTTTTTTTTTTQRPATISPGNLESLLNSFSTPSFTATTPKHGQDDAEFLNSLRDIGKLRVTTSMPPTFANRIIELALQNRDATPTSPVYIPERKTTTPPPFAPMPPVKRPTILPANDVEKHHQDQASLSADLSLLSTLLGRRITVADLPQITQQFGGNRQPAPAPRRTTSTTPRTTRRTTTTTTTTTTDKPMTRDEIAEIEKNLNLLSSLLGRPVSLNELPLIMQELRSGRKPKGSPPGARINLVSPGAVKTTTTNRPRTTLSVQSQTPISQEEVIELLKDPSFGSAPEQLNIYGKTNDAVLAAVLKQRGIGPTHNNIPVNDLFLQGPTPTPYRPTRRPAPPPPPPTAQSRPLFDGLAWLWRAWQDTGPAGRAPRNNNRQPTAAASTRLESPLALGAFGGAPSPTKNSGEGGEYAELQYPQNPSFGQGNGLLTAAFGVTKAVTQFLGAAFQGAAKSVQSAFSQQALQQNNLVGLSG